MANLLIVPRKVTFSPISSSTDFYSIFSDN